MNPQNREIFEIFGAEMNSKFENIDESIYTRKVRAIIVDESGQTLLIQPLQYKDGNWTFVGGGVEDGETALQAVIREILEEVGIENFINVKQSESRHLFKFSADEKLRRGFDYDGQLADIFLVEVANNTKVTIQKEEVKDYCWVPIEDVQNFVKVPAQLKVFNDAIKKLYQSGSFCSATPF